LTACAAGPNMDPMSTAPSDQVAFNPFEPGFSADPYSQWTELRERSPVHETPLGFWLLLRHADVLRIVRDSSTSVEERNAAPTLLDQMQEEAVGDLDRGDRGQHAMLNLDPPDHTRLRRLVSKAFTPRAIQRLQPRIQQLVDEALDDAAERGEMELVGDLAFPLPFAVISEMLGMPEADSDQLREWSGTLVRTLEPIADPELMRAIVDAGQNIEAFTREVIDWKRANPSDDMLSALIAAEEEGDKLSDVELVAQVVLLYIAGHETTVNLIGNGTLALLRHRDQLERLRDDPSLDSNAVDELLRYDPPVQMTRRITLADLDVDGHRIEAGKFMVCVLAAANRDPAHFGADADRVDITRENAGDHVAFGGGVHFCLGAALAKLEGQAAIGSLIRRFPDLEQSGDEVWNGRINLRGLDRLPLSLG
jgi:cytochrome P450